jgi:hypothetical protein
MAAEVCREVEFHRPLLDRVRSRNQ